MTSRIVDINAFEPIRVPAQIAVCPYCNAELIVGIDEFSQEKPQEWKASSVCVQCLSEPDLDSPEWDYWLAQHSVMPYVYQLPVDLKVIDWLNHTYTFME